MQRGRNKVKNKTKRALTGSVISVLVCTAMLVGTTFAWFTDSVSTGKNTITAGSLTVDLIDEEGNSLEGKTLNWSVADGRAQEEILWEPGAVYVTEGFRVKNTGNLALKYKLTVDGAAGDDKLLEAIELSVVKEAGKEGEAVDIDSYEGYLEGGETESDMLYIRAHMKEDAGNEYMGLKLEGIGITVAAAQDTVETDSFDSQYDAAAGYMQNVTTEDELKKALEAGDDIKLMNDISLSDKLVIAEDKNITIELGEKTLTACGLITNNGDLTIKNGTLTQTNNTYVTANYGTLTMENVTLNNVKFGIHDYGELTIINSDINVENYGIKTFNDTIKLIENSTITVTAKNGYGIDLTGPEAKVGHIVNTTIDADDSLSVSNSQIVERIEGCTFTGRISDISKEETKADVTIVSATVKADIWESDGQIHDKVESYVADGSTYNYDRETQTHIITAD